MLATAKVNQSKFKHQEQRTLPNAKLEFIKKKNPTTDTNKPCKEFKKKLTNLIFISLGTQSK